MVTDAQARLLRQKRMKGKTQAVRGGGRRHERRTAREWETGPLPSESKQER